MSYTLTRSHLISRSISELLSTDTIFGKTCDGGDVWIQTQVDMEAVLDNISKPEWMIWGVIHLEYDSDGLLDAMAGDLEQTQEVIDTVQAIKNHTNIDLKASLAAVLFDEEAASICDTGRTYINNQ